MADLTYNGVTLAVAKTNSVDHRAIYTEDNTTYLYTEVTIDVDAILNPQWNAYEDGPTASPGTLPPDTIKAIRHNLLVPQQQLSYTTPDGLGNVVSVVDNPQAFYPIDVNNGPMPLSCTIREVTGARTWLVNYKIRTWIHECPDEDNPGPLLSNRWAQSSSINRQRLATKTTTGMAHFRADVLARTGRRADHYRSVLMPPISPGYFRETVNVTANPAGNVLQYAITDVEQATDIGETSTRSGGSGIVKIDGFYGVGSIATKEGIPGGTTMAQCDVKAWGTKDASNWVMIQRCFEIVLAKITIGGGAIGFIRQAAIRESLVDRYVEVNIGFQQTAPANAMIGVLRIDGLRKDRIFADTLVNPGLPNDGGSRGTAEEELVVAALTEACDPRSTTTANSASGGSGSSSVYQGPTPSINVFTRDILPEEPSHYSTETQQYPYTSGHTDTLYYTKEGILAAPVAGDPKASDFRPVATFRLHSPIGYKVVEFTMERVGAMPSIPDPDPASYDEKNLVLLESELTGATPEYVDDGASQVFRISGRYKYVYSKETNGPGIGTLNLGVLPWTTDAPGSAAIRPSDYDTVQLGDEQGSNGTGI